ncbi:unnamed protein product, partial [marine sediment metagenome]
RTWSSCTNPPDGKQKCNSNHTSDGGWPWFGNASNVSYGSTIAQHTVADLITAGKYSMAAYQSYLTDVYAGQAVMMLVLGLDDEFNFAPFFDYLERIFAAPWNGACLSAAYCSPSPSIQPIPVGSSWMAPSGS